VFFVHFFATSIFGFPSFRLGGPAQPLRCFRIHRKTTFIKFYNTYFLTTDTTSLFQTEMIKIATNNH